MIYTFLHGVGPKRLEEARMLADRVIQLDPTSHRDPTGAIPAMAEAVRQRQFDHVAVTSTVKSGRLTVLSDIEDSQLAGIVHIQVQRLRRGGCKTVGIFGHSNEGVAALGAALTEAGVDHVLVGIPEAHIEALGALISLCFYGIGVFTRQEMRLGLATFLTACTRGSSAPQLALDMAAGKPLPARVQFRLQQLEQNLRNAAKTTMADLASVARQGWKAIGITSGLGPWRRAYPDFNALVRPIADLQPSNDLLQRMFAVAESRKPASLIDFDSTHGGPVQLMNFYQTKGREADGVILAYRTSDYLANHRHSEPFLEASRVLFVSLTRARQQAVIILPPNPHPLIAPFLGIGRTV